jgi:glycosyltransferase involved in cell wall biosynthesis
LLLKTRKDEDVEPITVVIPVYNEADAIEATINEIHEVLINTNIAGEIIVVDDGSSDHTPAIVTKTPARLIQHPQNKGYGAALKTGIRQAENDIIVIIDADGTYPCNMIPAIVSEMDTHDMVVGARIGDIVKVPFVRRPAKWLLNKLANYLSGMIIPDLNSGLRVFRRAVVMDYFRLLPSGFSFTTSITLAMLTNDYNVLYVPINYYERTGNSKIRPVRDTVNFFSLVVRMVLSYRPLRVFVPLGFILGLISLAKVIFDILTYDLHIATSTVVLLTLTFQMVVLGLIADLVVSLHKT